MRAASFLAFLLSFVLSAPFLSSRAQDEGLLIKDATLFQEGEWKEGRFVFMKKGKIRELSKAVPEGKKAERSVDGKGHYLLPPLVNAHVHLWRSQPLKKALGYGIFALLDMHTSDETAQRMRSFNDSLRYASYYSSNAGATVPKGHGTQFGIKVPTIDSATDPESFVMDRIEAGADYIKILREPRRPTVSFEQTQQIIDVAHREDKMVVAHVSRKDDAVKLVEQGVDGLAHVWSDEPIEREELERMAKREVFVIPTLLVIKRMMKKDKGANGEGWMRFEQVLKEVGRLHEAGVRILAGTDPPNAGIDYTGDLFEEMGLLHKAGLSKEEVLKAATSNIYEAFEPLPPYGFHPEKSASFLLLKEKPTAKFNIAEKLDRLYKKGEPLDPAALVTKSTAQDDPKGEGELTLSVGVDEMRSSKGKVLLQLKNGEQEKVGSKMASIEEKSCEVRFEGLEKGSYAVSVIHDENGNGKFDKNEQYIPEEGWGYSNNVKAKGGRPPFSEQLVDVKADTTIRIHMDYYER
ncbi:MAG: DUF2141 domain-containing protein [Flavobacteriales bacterium]